MKTCSKQNLRGCPPVAFKLEGECQNLNYKAIFGIASRYMYMYLGFVWQM
jgi:hypothetical protein